MFGTLGGPELLLILVIALIVFGPTKLPEMGKSLGKMLVEFRRASNDFKRTIEDEVEADKMRSALEATRIDVPAAPAAAPAAALAAPAVALGAPEGALPQATPAGGSETSGTPDALAGAESVPSPTAK